MIKDRSATPILDDQPAVRGNPLRMRAIAQFGIDTSSWAIAVVGALLFRHDFMAERIVWSSAVGLTAVLALVYLVWGWPLRLFQRRYAYGSFEEVRAVGLATVGTAVTVALPAIMFGSRFGLPRSTELIAFPMAALLMFLSRYAVRVWQESNSGPGEAAVPAILYGAGYVGRVVVHRLLTDRASAYRPVALLDDDPAKQHSRIRVLPTISIALDGPQP